MWRRLAHVFYIPYIMLEYADDIVFGLRAMMKAVSAPEGVILIEDNKPEAIQALKEHQLDGIVLEAKGFWVIGLLKVIVEAVKNIILNAQLESRLRNS